MKIKRKIIPWKMGKKAWHSEEWKKKKRRLRRELRRIKKRKTSREEYIKKRNEYKAWCKIERERYEKEEEERIESIKTEEEAWKYINRYRKKREKMNEDMDLEEWRQHFKELLGGTENRVIDIEETQKKYEKIKEFWWEKKKEEKEEEKKTEKEEEKKKEEEKITKEEFVEHLKKLKKGKAPGENEIKNEAWRLMPTEIGEVLWKLINKIWKEGEIPEKWNRGLISPIYKKGRKDDVKNYRGVTLMDTAYKIYADILNERLQREVERKLEKGQFGFRKGRGTIDAIYTLNFVVNREIAKKKGKVCFFFCRPQGSI